MVPAWLLLLGVACFLQAGIAAEKHEICKLPPSWTAKDFNPMAKSRKHGNMTVLAILDANCGYCIMQATLLQRLKTKLERKGMKNITYMIINMKKSLNEKYRLDRVVDFEVYQDTDGHIVDQLGGSKDDFFVYDRCGRLGYYLHHGITYLGWPHVSKAILYTYQSKHGCGNVCPTETPEPQSAISKLKNTIHKASGAK